MPMNRVLVTDSNCCDVFCLLLFQVSWCYAVLSYSCQKSLSLLWWAHLQGHFQNQHQASGNLYIFVQHASWNICFWRRRVGYRSLFTNPSDVHILPGLGSVQFYIPGNHHQEWSRCKYFWCCTRHVLLLRKSFFFARDHNIKYLKSFLLSIPKICQLIQC